MKAGIKDRAHAAFLSIFSCGNTYKHFKKKDDTIGKGD
jgi:hypothetical protein